MESITNFLDPKSIPNITGDELEVDKELDKKSDLDTDSDTIEVNITNKIEPPKAETKTKVKDTTLPGKLESLVDDEKDDSKEESSEEETSSEESSSEEETSKEETKEEEPKEEAQKEEAAEDSTTEAAEPETDKEEPVETSADADTVETTVSDKEVKADQEETSDKEEKADAEEKEDAQEQDAAAAIDNGESDLDVDQNQEPPLLKLIGESDFYFTKVYETPNGAKVVYVNKPSDLCMCQFDYKVGSFYEDDSNRGISHLLEHLMFNGCPGISSLEFNAKLDKLGMSVNAFTSRMVTAFHFVGLKANFIPAFDLFANLLNSFTPTQEIVDKERGIVINEIGVYNDDNWSCLHEAVHAQSYRQHPIAHPILGYEDVIRNITVEQVKSWYETNYNTKNLTVYLVGEFPEEDLVYVAGKLQLFRDGAPNANPVITDAMALPFYKNVITHKEGATQTLIDVTLPFKNEAFNIYELNILANVLGGTMSSYLWNAFREERSIAYRVGAYPSNMDPEHLNIHLYAGLNNSDDADVAKGIFHDAFQFAKAITEDDFNKGLNISVADQLKAEETQAGVLDLVRDAAYFGLELDAYVSTLKNLTYDSYQGFAESIDSDAMVTGILYPMQ